MKNAVMLPNDVTSDGSRTESESTRLNVRSISMKKKQIEVRQISNHLTTKVDSH